MGRTFSHLNAKCAERRRELRAENIASLPLRERVGEGGGEAVRALPEALTLDVDDAVWTVRGRFDAAAVALADRHYSREKPGTPQLGGPGYLLVFVTPCELAVWVSKRHAPEIFDGKRTRTTADGFRGYRCGLFRNESRHRASDLIQAAVALTESIWGTSEHGWMTYVDTTKVASTNPGYCFKQAGWRLDRSYRHDRLVRLTLVPRSVSVSEAAA